MLENEMKKEKQWIPRANVPTAADAEIRKIANELGINPIIAKLLYSRGCHTVNDAKAFIYMETEILANPFEMADMEKGIARVRRAIENGEKITVYGDYDVDGVTSVCTLYLYLKSQGADIEYYIPNRTGEGYGVSSGAIDAVRATGTRLVITVDTGITANDEVEYAKKIGMDFVITDHHECRAELPSACAVINPHRPDCPYPFKELAGVGVVFKFVCAYEERYNRVSRLAAAANIFSKYADLVAIGTIADVMPIKSENRIIVAYGLKMIEDTARPGLEALMELSSHKVDSGRDNRRKKKTKITSSYIGYTLAPRINAAGRIKSATEAVELFLQEDRDRAYEIAEALCAANRERQTEENKIMQEAYKKIEELDVASNPVIVLDSDDWHHGVIGIVSSRITDRYSRPSILISFEGNDPSLPYPEQLGKGSGRSIKGMNLVDALCYCNDHLAKFGGHELAAGLSVRRDELPTFIKKINEYAKNNLTDEDMIPTVDTDFEIDFSDVSVSLAEEVRILEPYGVDNPVPVFVLRGVFVNEISGVSEGRHTKLTVGDGRRTVSAMYFSISPNETGVRVGDTVDILFNIDINEWAGRKNVQLIVRDIKLSSGIRNDIDVQKKRFEEIKSGARFDASEDVIPCRDDFAQVYKFMLASQHSGIDTLSHRDICAKLSCGGSGYISYIKLKVIIMVMRELNIVHIDEVGDEIYKFSIHYTTAKTDLEKSGILRKLRSQKNL